MRGCKLTMNRGDSIITEHMEILAKTTLIILIYVRHHDCEISMTGNLPEFLPDRIHCGHFCLSPAPPDILQTKITHTHIAVRRILPAPCNSIITTFES